MEFRYDFGEKLDLTRFRKQAPYHIGQMRELTYNFFLDDYKVVAEIAALDNSTKHRGAMYFMDIKRDANGVLVSQQAVLPLSDTRFKEIKFIQEIFTMDGYKAYFESSSVEETVGRLCSLIQLVHKINHLKAFI